MKKSHPTTAYLLDRRCPDCGVHSFGPVQAATNDLLQTAAESARPICRGPGRARHLVPRQWTGGRGREDAPLAGPQRFYKLYVPVLPDEIGPAKLPADASEKAAEWDARLSKLRHEQAAALFELARRAVRSGQAGLAFDLALARVRADPDYEPARRLFGYQKFRDQWHTVYEVRKLCAGNVWSEKFGWLPKATFATTRKGSATATAAGFPPRKTPTGTATSARVGTWKPSITRSARITASRPAWRWA